MTASAIYAGAANSFKTNQNLQELQQFSNAVNNQPPLRNQGETAASAGNQMIVNTTLVKSDTSASQYLINYYDIVNGNNNA